MVIQETMPLAINVWLNVHEVNKRDQRNYLKQSFYITRANLKTLLVSTLFYNKKLILKKFLKVINYHYSTRLY